MSKTCFVCKVVHLEMIGIFQHPKNLDFMLRLLLGLKAQNDDYLCKTCCDEVINAFRYKKNFLLSNPRRRKLLSDEAAVEDATVHQAEAAISSNESELITEPKISKLELHSKILTVGSKIKELKESIFTGNECDTAKLNGMESSLIILKKAIGPKNELEDFNISVIAADSEQYSSGNRKLHVEECEEQVYEVIAVDDAEEELNVETVDKGLAVVHMRKSNESSILRRALEAGASVRYKMPDTLKAHGSIVDPVGYQIELLEGSKSQSVLNGSHEKEGDYFDAYLNYFITENSHNSQNLSDGDVIHRNETEKSDCIIEIIDTDESREMEKQSTENYLQEETPNRCKGVNNSCNNNNINPNHKTRQESKEIRTT